MIKWIVAILAYILSDKRLTETIIRLAKVLAARSTNTIDDAVVVQIEKLLNYIPSDMFRNK